MSYFVLMEAGFDYNDEVYLPSEGGNPSRVFTSKEAAEKVMLQKNIDQFKNILEDGSIKDYGYSLDEVLDHRGSSDELDGKDGIFMKLFGKTASEWWDNVTYFNDNQGGQSVVEPSDSDWARLLNCFNFNFYYVVEVQG